MISSVCQKQGWKQYSAKQRAIYSSR